MTSAASADSPTFEAFAARFEASFGARASAIVRAPGRVNLIGEHTDYNLLPVMPFAMQREVRIAVRPRTDAMIVVRNVDPRWAERRFELGLEIAPFDQGDWGNYVKAAARFLARECGARRGCDVLVESDLPAAAGLSSSSALIVACGLAIAHANQIVVERSTFAERCARAEHYVGTNSGGMDQAVCMLGQAGHALRIQFDPLRASPLRLPEAWRFVVAHSLVFADKSGAARGAYNARRAECGAALEMLIGADDLPRSYPRLLKQLGAERMGWLATQRLAGDLLRRFRHQISEATRVERAEHALIAEDATWFGALMDESHASLADDYDVSHPELDQLVRVARSSGARGARLTGAGFGGCIIALCLARDVDRLVRGLREGFYARRGTEPRVAEPILVAAPCDGASVHAV